MKAAENTMIRSASGLLTLLVMTSATGAEPDLSDCAREQSDAARLACYDRLAQGTAATDHQAREATAASEEHAAAAEAAVSGASGREPDVVVDEKAEAVANFGMNRNVAEANETAPPELDEIHAVIVDIETLRSGKRVITLDNGQVWREQSATKSLRLKPGDEVRIKAGVLGSFKLLDANRRSSRVERIR